MVKTTFGKVLLAFGEDLVNDYFLSDRDFRRGIVNMMDSYENRETADDLEFFGVNKGVITLASIERAIKEVIENQR